MVKNVNGNGCDFEEFVLGSVLILIVVKHNMYHIFDVRDHHGKVKLWSWKGIDYSV